ncbi:MAG: DivIVA domain-containing protein [Clostridia bacterium]|nr:DivIVA domain-containing protein [Clostridia bacterium]
MKKAFSCKIYGYDKKEVDRYLIEMKKDYEVELGRKRDRMLELAEETRALRMEAQEQRELIEKLTEQEKYVSRALIKAEQRAQTIIEEGRRKSAKEMEQLVSEKEKWRIKFRQVRQELMTFERNLLQVIEKFRDDINYYSAKEISDTILVGDSETDGNDSKTSISYYFEKNEDEISEEVASSVENIRKEKVIA